METDFLIIGGGIAGISCLEILSFLKPEQKIILISESPIVKAVTNFHPITKLLTVFDVIEQEITELEKKYQNLTVLHDTLTRIDSDSHSITTSKGIQIKYRSLCLCIGARPKIIPQAQNSPFVLGIRDTDSVETFTSKLSKSKRVAIVGNGGIATEMVYKLQNIHIDWVVKENHTSATFLDPGASEFFKGSLDGQPTSNQLSTRLRFKVDEKGSGAALGPDWYSSFLLSGEEGKKSIKIHYGAEVQKIEKVIEGVRVFLTNGDEFETDLIVSATGVLPKGDTITTDVPLNLSEDHGIKVDEFMETNLPDVFAAGDICTPAWTYAKHWFPMKLWTQARQMGCYAAKCMVAKIDNEKIFQDFNFELFAHSTNFFGFKLVLLGLYNGQKLGTDYECLIRMTKNEEFVKFVLQDNKLQGAILIGNTDLAETCENLILNQLDLSPYGDDILNPDIDIEDYFD